MRSIYVGNIPVEAVDPIMKCYKKMMIDAIDNRDFDVANDIMWKMQSLWTEACSTGEVEE